jgi:hypothetical protein
MNRSTLLATIVVIVAGGAWTSQPAQAQETPKETGIKSGPQAGKPIPGPFHPLAVTHAEDPGHAGKRWDFVEQYGLTKIDRTIGKEPAYASKPKYCLVVFGPEAKTRVWLVLDGEILYADRNGDGDLTGKDQRVPIGYRDSGPVFQVGNIPARHGAGPFTLEVEVRLHVGKEDTYVIWCRPQEGKGFLQRTDGLLYFGDKPGEAPIVHFGGPLTLTILDWHKPLQPRQLVRGDKDNQLSILIGTPVFGGKHEVFATVYQSFRRLAGDKSFPTVEIEFPGKDPGAKPITTRAEVSH